MELFLLCIKIFFVRIIDVTLATTVTILTVKNNRIFGAILGFIDVLIWFLIVKEALNTPNQSFLIAFSYASGYGVGTFVGTTISNKFIKGNVLMQVISTTLTKNDINILRKNKYAVTEVACNGKDDSKNTMLFIELDNKYINHLKKLIIGLDKNAFIIINDTKHVENGFFR